MTDTTPTPAQQQATIGRRMVQVMQGIERLVKSKQMETGQKYKYVSHDQVVEAVRGLMCEAGIVMQQRITHTNCETQEVEGYKGQKVQQICYDMRMAFDFCSADNLEDKVTVEAAGMGIDRSDKATGKAMSYCKKYAILQAFLISTGDDPDHDQTTQQGQTRAQRQQAPPVKQEQPAPVETAVDWGALCNDRFKMCAENGLKDDATTIWKASRTMKESAQVLAIKLKQLYDRSEQIMYDNGEPEQ